MTKTVMKKTKRRILNLFVLCVFAVLSFVMTGCSDQEKPVANGTLNMVATTTMLADLAKEISGEHVNVTGLMGPGIDPHLYQASAGDVTSMQNADIVLYNGLHLEGKMGDIFASLEGSGRAIICIEKGLDPEKLLEAEENPDIHDPHVWFDVSLWQEAATYIAQRLTEIDPEHKEVYETNVRDYLSKLNDLDAYIKGRVQELPEHQRVLITAHDAFRYFGNAYGFEVKGLQGISTDAEAGTADVSSLATFIAEREIKAIFVESSVPPKTIQALKAAVKAKGFDVTIGGELYSDSLGDVGSSAKDYIGTFTANIDTIVNALR